MSLPSWKLPAGVSRGTWDYLQSEHIASDYDRYFAEHPLMRLDVPFVVEHLPPLNQEQPALIADLGCGTGRVSRALSPLGYRMLNVDLSQHMLDQLMKQTQHPELNQCLQANLVELECLEPSSLDMAVCLFSSIGMIRGRKNRVRFLSTLRPALKPRAKFILHAHNRYHSLWDPSGPTWLLATKWKSLWQKDWEFGDRVYSYRGLPAMFLHIYCRRELRQDLIAAGFKATEFFPLNVTGDAIIPSTPLSTLKAGGYFVIAS
jgi:SAM-dependent methyltransferase